MSNILIRFDYYYGFIFLFNVSNLSSFLAYHIWVIMVTMFSKLFLHLCVNVVDLYLCSVRWLSLEELMIMCMMLFYQ